MRGKAIFALLVTIFMMTPVQAGEVNTFQTQQNNPEQPSMHILMVSTISGHISVTMIPIQLTPLLKKTIMG
jgi:uncharacterized integral membrane protein